MDRIVEAGEKHQIPAAERRAGGHAWPHRMPLRFGYRPTCGSERGVRRSAALRKRTDMWQRACERVRSAHPILRCSFPRGGISQQVLIPETVKASGPGRGHVTASHGAEGAALHGRPHVNVNDEQADGKQGTTRVDEHGSVAEIAK